MRAVNGWDARTANDIIQLITEKMDADDEKAKDASQDDRQRFNIRFWTMVEIINAINAKMEF